MDTNSYRELLDAAIKEDERKMAAIETVVECIEKAQAMAKKTLKVKIKATEVDALTESNPEFAAATETGFSDEVIRSYVITAFDHLLSPLELEKLKSSMLVLLGSVALKKPLDFSKLNGEAVYNYISNKEEFIDTLKSPDFKKQCIFGEAVKIVVEKKTISFNTAVRRAIAKYEKEMTAPKCDSEDEEVFAELAAIINPLIDLYLENELDILAALGK